VTAGIAWAPRALKNPRFCSFLPFGLPEQPRLPSHTSQLLPRLGRQNRSVSQGDLGLPSHLASLPGELGTTEPQPLP